MFSGMTFINIIESPSKEDLAAGRSEGKMLTAALELAHLPHSYSLVGNYSEFMTAPGNRCHPLRRSQTRELGDTARNTCHPLRHSAAASPFGFGNRCRWNRCHPLRRLRRRSLSVTPDSPPGHQQKEHARDARPEWGEVAGKPKRVPRVWGTANAIRLLGGGPIPERSMHRLGSVRSCRRPPYFVAAA